MNRLTNAQLTSRVIDLVATIVNGERIEDALVEAKADWIDPFHAARQLAAHANAALGEDVLWILGLKEGEGVKVLSEQEPAAWFAQVAAAFDGPAPRVHDLKVDTPHGRVHALSFTTQEPPYVIAAKPAANQKAPEILWRESTGVRHARRADLLRLLLPRAQLPEIEVLTCTLFAHDRTDNNLMLQLELYVVPAESASAVFPNHRQRGELRRDQMRASFATVELRRPVLASNTPQLKQGDSELVVLGPAKVQLTAQGQLPIVDLRAEDRILAYLELHVVGGGQPAVVTIPLTHMPTQEHAYRYILAGRPWE